MNQSKGFSLIELAIAIFVITLLLGGLLVPLSSQVEQRQISDTRKYLEEIKEALIGFAVANGRLPCPASSTSAGVADPPTPGACPNFEGFLPWATLNVAQGGDAWGNRFRYRVASEFTNTPLSDGTCVVGDGRLGLCDNGNITVNTRDSTTKATQAIANNVVALILSHGRNGYGATSTDNDLRAPVPGANVDEAANVDLNATFVYRTPSGVSSPCSDTAPGQPFCEFDDIVTWVSAYTIFNRMVAAGRLP